VSFSLDYEVLESEAKWIISRYHLAYPGVRQNYHRMIRDLLSEGLPITNLMGRKTRLLGPIDDRLLKRGYSCIPQGSVGDIINERGISFLYYDKLGEPVELLTQTHDAIAFQIPLSIPLVQHAEILLALKRSLEIPLNWEGRDFVIPADISFGFNLCKELSVDIKAKKCPDNPEALALMIGDGIEKLKTTQVKG
jgi:DNA polymerase I-like protein with 3'-5' exonuclease and polymerase domains